MERNKGITLIALIITIIILLILVGVSINLAIKGDLFGSAQKAVSGTNDKTAQEQTRVDELMGELDKVEEQQRQQEELEKSKNLPGTRVTEPTEYKEGNKTAVIPAGFTVSKAEGETTINGGLVIYLINDKTEEEIKKLTWTGTELENLKKTYDQFVWIPISHEQINNMFICQEKTTSNGSCNIVAENGVAKCTVHNSTQMAGRLYATSTGESYNNPKKEVYTANSGLREPDVVTGNSTGDGTSYDGSSAYLGYMSTATGDNTSYASTAKFKETLQNEYNEIVALVYNAGGYYVGRYETSNITTTKGTAINVVAGKNSKISHINWYYMYAQQKAYAANKGLGNKVKSSMMLGTCHDQMLEFVNVAGKYDVTKAGNVGHTSSKFTTKPYLTGGVGYNENYSGYETEPYKDLSKNIYDLEGNVYEWTTEAVYTGSRVLRGRQLRLQLFC